MFQLIMLESPIIVSDEEIKEIHDLGNGTYNKGYYINNQWSKVIAELPQIDWNGLEAEFGYVYVEKLAFEETRRLAYSGVSADRDSECFIWTKGFKKAQELNNKMFSLEDMKNAYKQAYKQGFMYAMLCEGGPHDLSDDVDWDDYENLLTQPKVFSIEVEMEEVWFNGLGFYTVDALSDQEKEKYSILKKERPKIINNKIKITKKC